MADIIDEANERAELRLRKQLEVRKPAGPEPTGYCLNCDQPFDPEDDQRRWCDADCRDDWELRHRRGH